MKYAKSTGGFYDPEIHKGITPPDAKEISEARYHELMNAQARGKIIAADEEGYPHAIERVYTLDELRQQKILALELIKDKKIAAGLPYLFPDGVSGTIHPRSGEELWHLMFIMSLLDQRSIPGEKIPFPDAENVIHHLSMDEMKAMGSTIASFITDIYLSMWTHKAKLLVCATEEEVKKYDITT